MATHCAANLIRELHERAQNTIDGNAARAAQTAMENRFGLRDFLLTTLLVVLIVSVWLLMKQFDRQWEKIIQLSQQLSQQATSDAQLRRDMADLHELVEKLGEQVAQSPELSKRITELQLLLTELAQRNVDRQTLAQKHAQLKQNLAQTQQKVPASSSPSKSPADTDPFQRVREAKAKPDYAEGDWIVDAFSANVARITPLVTGDAYGTAIQNRVLESLITRDPDTLDFQPLIARSWSISEDGLTITFKLRRGITFSDSRPLTAEDIAYTFELINNPDIDAPRSRNYYDKLESVTATSPHEVVFKFKEKYFQALGMAGGMSVLPKHFYSQFTAKQINREPGLLLGSGPYRMESPTQWAPGKPLILVRNERYWGEPTTFDKLAYREINNDVARLTAFRNREIDLFGAMPEQYVKMLREQEILDMSRHYEYERPTSGYGFIAWNGRRDDKPTVFADKRVRRAMTMLIDRQWIDKEILLGFGIIPSGPFNRLSKQYDQSVEPLPYDEPRAKQLLAEVGFADRNNDGVLESPDGNPFEFKHTYPATGGSSGFWDRVSLFLKDSFARAGIVLAPDPLEWAVFKEKLQTRQFDAISLAWGGGLESDIRQMFHSTQIADGADNFTNYQNTELDQLIDEARRTIDEAKRMPLWNACHSILNEDQPYTFLYSRKSLQFIEKRIHNVGRTRIGLNDRDEWYVPVALQKHHQ